MTSIASVSSGTVKSTSIVPMAFVRGILAAYDKYGIDPTSTLIKAQIQPECVDNIQSCVTADQFEDLNWEAMQELDDEALGWFSRKLPWGSYGMLCRASLGAATLGLALQRWTRHHRLLTGDILMVLDVTDSIASIAITETYDLGNSREFCLVTLLRYILGFACWAVDEKITLTAAEFPYSPPQHRDVYTKLFCPNLHFNAVCTRIQFEANLLERPLQRNEAAINLMLKRALPLTVLPYKSEQQLTSQVRRMLRMAKNSLPAAEEVAAVFNLSTRSLHRHLAAESASLRALKEQVQMERAKEALLRTTQPIKRVAFIAGFQSEKSFSRAFRSWTGQTPTAFRHNEIHGL